MPIYEYYCNNCSHRFDLKQSFKDINSEVVCPKCKAVARRVFSPVPIIFKGQGFYVTDHSAKNSNFSSSKKDGDKPAGADSTQNLSPQTRIAGGSKEATPS